MPDYASMWLNIPVCNTKFLKLGENSVPQCLCPSVFFYVSTRFILSLIAASSSRLITGR